MAGNLTRINNNQITDAVSGNTQYGINANTKVQQYSVTSTLLANNLTYGSDLTITGNLSVTGNVTAIDTTNTTIEDPLLLLASNQTGSPTVDIGYIGQRGTSNNIAFVWDESFKSFVTVYTDSGAGDNTNINILSYADFITANANVTGNLLAVNVSLSGNVISDLNVTGTTTSNVIVSVNDVSALGNIVTNNTVNTGNLSLSGVVISDLSVNGNVSATGNVIAANFSTSGSGGNISGANVISSISVTATGNIGAGQYLFGNGYYITDINPANVAVTKITNGNSYANIATADANLVVAIGTNSNIVATFYDDGVDFGGDISSVGNVYANAGLYGNTLSLSGNITSDLNVSGNIIPSTDNVYTLGNATNTWSAGYFSPNTLYIGTVKLGANNAANVATINNQVIPVYTNGNLDLSATGNIAAGNTFNSVNLSLSGNVISPLNVTGTVTAQYVVATIDVSSLGNVVAYNSINANNASLSGNVISPLNVTGTATAQYVVATIDVSSLGNVVAYDTVNSNNLSLSGNVISPLNVTGTATAQYVVATIDVSALGNVVAYDTVNSNNLSLSGNVISPLNVTGTATAQYVVATNDVSALGNVVAANFTTTGPQGNISGANVISGITLTASGNVYGQYLVTPNTTINSGVFTTGVVSATGNIQTANYLIGNGYYITDINPANVAVSLISNGNSYANIATYNGNLVVAIGASANTVATFYDNGVNFGGDISTVGNVSVGSGNILDSANTGIQLYSANIAQLNYSNTGLVTADSTGILLQTGSYVFTLSTTGDISAPGAFSALGNISTSNNIITTGLVTATGNVYGGNAVIATDISAGGNILTSGYVSASGNIQSGTTLLVDTTTSSVSLGANVQETTGATLAINATDSMLIPVGNTAQRPVTPATGMLRYNSTLSECEVWNGAAWVTVGGSTFTVIQNEQFNGDGSTTTFTLASSQTTDSCIVTINGVVQIPTTAYSVSGVYPSCVLTFTEAPEVGDTIDVREITTTVTVTAISNSSGNSVVSVQETTGEVDITGNLVAQLNPAAPSLATNSTMSFQLVNNTTLKILVRGTDGTTRSANITLA